MFVYANDFIEPSAMDYAGNVRTVSSEELIVDSSPPMNGIILINDAVKGTYLLPSSTMRLRLQKFYDHHSGIDHFNVGIGSTSDTADVLQFDKYTSHLIDVSLEKADIVDGHTYFVTVQVFKCRTKCSNVSIFQGMHL